MSEVPPTPWEQVRDNKRSERQEVRVASKGRGEKGRRQVNSGRVWFSPRDVRRNGFLIECRTTRANSYTVTRPEFETLTKQALGTPPGQLPAMQVDLEGQTTLSLFVMRYDDHLYFMEYIGILEARVKELEAELKTDKI